MKRLRLILDVYECKDDLSYTSTIIRRATNARTQGSNNCLRAAGVSANSDSTNSDGSYPCHVSATSAFQSNTLAPFILASRRDLDAILMALR